MKKTILITLCLLSGFAAGAQMMTPRPQYKQIVAENELLKARIDSLCLVIDSLKQAKANDDVIIEAISPLVDVSGSSEIATDSISIDGLDFEKYAGNVPDSVYIKRLERMNIIFSLPYNETVRKYIILYSEKYRTQTEKMMGDAKYYFPIFEEVFARYDMPLELKYMAIIESALKPRATSRMGAKGIWQFMYSSAVTYGLRINSYADERMDVHKATDAAARHLLDSYNVFGDWALAICAYNCGVANVDKAIKAAGSQDFWSIYPYLPKETRGYVPAFVGAMYAFTYYREYGLTPGENPMPDPVDTVHIHKALHFRQINELVGPPMEIIDVLNTQYLHQIIPGEQGDYILRLPRPWMERFYKFNDESLYEHKKDELFPSKVLASSSSGSGSGSGYRVITVKSGDTLSGLAKRYGTSVNAIKKANKMSGTTIRKGQKLRIP